ncbi:MAG: Rieske 2Fe-2S domain-containing protein [Elainellaceae cyanobacterium]
MTTDIRLQRDSLTEPDGLNPADDLPFQWTKQWYPVAVIECLDPSRPHPIQLLGNDLVIWCDRTGQWRCFADACPHRSAPLSEGRVEADGTLLCAYHGWRFAPDGGCDRIPQAPDPATEAKHCANPKSCAIAYPTQARQGLLWVWAEPGSEAQVESQLREPRLIPELEQGSDRVVKMFWNIRDLPYGWDFFMENVADPAHVPVAHHGLVGDRYNDAKYYDMPRIREMSTQDGCAFGVTPTASTIREAVHDFQPPCHMRIATTFDDGGMLILALYATPTRPGWCRHIGCQVLVKNDTGKTPKGLAFFALPMPSWLGHVLASLFLHQDLVFLHYQEKIVAKRHPQRWLDQVYTPNPQDKMVIAIRQWLEKRAGGAIPWASSSDLPPPEYDKQKLFDVWATHTQHCQICQNALKTITRMTTTLFALAVVGLLLGILIDAQYVATQAAIATLDHLPFSWSTVMPPAGVWLAWGGAALCAVGGYLLKQFSRLFYVYEFEHAHND